MWSGKWGTHYLALNMAKFSQISSILNLAVQTLFFGVVGGVLLGFLLVLFSVTVIHGRGEVLLINMTSDSIQRLRVEYGESILECRSQILPSESCLVEFVSNRESGLVVKSDKKTFGNCGYLDAVSNYRAVIIIKESDIDCFELDTR
jgi:hypothetical protein